MRSAQISFKDTGASLRITSSGEWNHIAIPALYKQLNQYKINPAILSVAWDFSGVKTLDTAGIMLIIQFMRRFDASKVSFTYTGLKPEHQRKFLFYRKNAIYTIPDNPQKKPYLYRTGKAITLFFSSFGDFLSFTGEMIYQLWLILKRPSLFRFKATLKHLDTSGLQALSIIALTSFLVGLVIAYQSAEQLRQFGANIFIVEMVSIAMFRELAPMIAAIVVAGRSASAYTAELGTMKITEEIDAMHTMGFQPHRFLVLPRVIGLMISMPLIVFFADLVGVMGGMIIANNQLGLSFSEFVSRMHTEVDIKHVLIGLIKAPFFGFIIALIGCFRGFQVTGGTDSIGNYTTISVVNAIFWVIASNALISVLLTEMGI